MRPSWRIVIAKHTGECENLRPSEFSARTEKGVTRKNRTSSPDHERCYLHPIHE